jgi:ATP-dependent DNA helicase PIF1
LEHILLNEQFRQKDDEDFTKFLNLIRIGKIDDWVIQKLNECRDRQWDDEDGDGKDLNKLSTEKSPKIEPTVLFPTNQKVDEGNENELNKLPGERKTFIAKDAGSDQGLERLNKNCLAPYHLNLKIGAQVMLVRNIDVLNGLVNGSRGVVIGYSYSDNDNHNGKTGNDRLVEKEILPIVKFASVPTPITIHPALWEIKGPDGNVEAQRWQFPLKLAWFLTVHKSQGLTLDRVLTTLEGMFEWGQVYVALSRCKSFKSLRIVGEITRSKIKAHPLAVRFYEKMENDMSKSLEIQRINV